SGNITRLGSDIYIAPGQVVVGDVVALGGDVTVAGHVEGDVASMGGDVYLKSSARVDGDVVCMGGKLNEEPGASVGGQRVSGLGGRRARLAYMLFLCLLWSWGFVIAATVLGEAVLGRTAGAASLATGGLPPGAAPAPVAGAMPGAIGVSAPPPSLTKRAVVGILLLAGAGVLGRLFQLIGFFGPLHALGALIHVLASIAGLVALTFGSGAWLRTELKAGT